MIPLAWLGLLQPVLAAGAMAFSSVSVLSNSLLFRGTRRITMTSCSGGSDDGSTTRQYGAANALVSGLYSLISATGGGGMMGTNSGWLMLLLGIVVLVHGVILLTPYGTAKDPRAAR